MTQFLLILAVALTVGAIGFGIAVLVSGDDKLGAAEPDGRSSPLPAGRPLTEPDLGQVRFDTGLRGYRMDQVDAALHRAAYDIGYKDELVKVLQAEVDALRDGRVPDADAYRRARQAALAPVLAGATGDADHPVIDLGSTVVSPPAAEPGTEPPADPEQPAAEVPAVVGPDPDEAERSGGPIAEEAGLPVQQADPEPADPDGLETPAPADPEGLETPVSADPDGPETAQPEPPGADSAGAEPGKPEVR